MKLMHFIFAAALTFAASSAFACDGENTDRSHSPAGDQARVLQALSTTGAPIATPVKASKGTRGS